MTEAVPVFEAKNKLPFYIHKAESEGPVFLSRRNKEVVVMLSVTEYNRLLVQAKENRKQMSILDRVKDFHERNKDLYSDAEIDEIFNSIEKKRSEISYYRDVENVWDGIMEGADD